MVPVRALGEPGVRGELAAPRPRARRGAAPGRSGPGWLTIITQRHGHPAGLSVACRRAA